jgi:hypothetical protein
MQIKIQKGLLWGRRRQEKEEINEAFKLQFFSI